MREKCSCVRLSREAITPFVVGSVTSACAVGGQPVAALVEQEPDHALGARAHRVGLEVAHELVEPAREAGDHPRREVGVAPELVEHRVALDVEQHRIRERLRGHHVRPAHEHHRLAEARPGAEDLDHLLVAAGRDERELDLAVDDDVEAVHLVAAVEQDLAARRPHLARVRRHAVELLRRELAEERQVPEEGSGGGGGRHGSGEW